MIILIGGESHGGKTLMAQRLLEKYKISYLSIDHIKMGLIRGLDKCEFTALDKDEKISKKLWGVIKGIINTCIENNQNLIIEGCYLPPDKVKEIISEKIIAVYIGFSKEYLEGKFNNILEFENIIEKRNYPEDREKSDYIEANLKLKEKCIENNLPYFEINNDYEEEIKEVYSYIESKVFKVDKYKEENLNEIINLFSETIKNINKRDYSTKQVEVWGSKDVNKKAWNESFLKNKTIVVNIGNKIVGFGDLDKNYLDRLYVHKEYQNRGIGKIIVKNLEDYARKEKREEIETHASITAVPFFKSLGYKIIKEQKVIKENVEFINFIMKKKLV